MRVLRAFVASWIFGIVATIFRDRIAKSQLCGDLMWHARHLLWRLNDRFQAFSCGCAKCSEEIEDLCSAAITFDYPRCLFKDIEDVTLFNLFEGAVRALN